MKLVTAEEFSKYVRFAPAGEEQLQEGWITLTLLQVEQILGDGSVSPLEGECVPARTVKRPVRQGSGEGGGWWELNDGVYRVTYNEEVTLPSGMGLLLQPHPALLGNGLWHPTLVVTSREELGGTLLFVGCRGVRLREESPLSRCLWVPVHQEVDRELQT